MTNTEILKKSVYILFLSIFILINNSFAEPAKIESSKAVGKSSEGAAYFDNSIYNLTTINDYINYYVDLNSCVSVPTHAELTNDTNEGAKALFELISKNISMLNPAAEGEIIAGKNGEPDKTRCNIPTNDIKICYTPFNFTDGTQGKCSDNILTFCTKEPCSSGAIKENIINGIRARSSYDKGVGCIEIFLPSVGWKRLGCKIIDSETNNKIEVKSCIVNDKCTIDTQNATRNLFSLTGYTYTCFKRMIDRILDDEVLCVESNNKNRKNLLPSFQNYLRGSVMILLAIYTVLFGMHIILGKAKSPAEAFTFFGKMLLVIYFSVGFGFTDSLNNNGVHKLYEFGISAMNGFANMIAESGAIGQGLCYFSKNDYTQEFQYMLIWDYLDCNIMFYFGMFLKGILIITGKIVGSLLLGFIPFAGPIITLVTIILSIKELIFVGIFFIFLALILSSAFYLIEVFLLSILIIAVLTFIAPIFVPMMLFQVTKNMFEKWLTIYIATIVQPAIVFAYLPLMLLILNNMIFENCKFNKIQTSKIEIYKGDSNFSYNVNPSYIYYLEKNGVADPNNSHKCMDSVGARFAPLIGAADTSNITLSIKEGFLFSWKALQKDLTTKSFFTDGWEKVLILAILAYIFSFISGYAAGIAADLTEASLKLGTNFDPNKMFKNIMDKTFKGANKIFGKDERNKGAMEVVRKSVGASESQEDSGIEMESLEEGNLLRADGNNRDEGSSDSSNLNETGSRNNSLLSDAHSPSTRSEDLNNNNASTRTVEQTSSGTDGPKNNETVATETKNINKPIDSKSEKTGSGQSNIQDASFKYDTEDTTSRSTSNTQGASQDTISRSINNDLSQTLPNEPEGEKTSIEGQDIGKELRGETEVANKDRLEQSTQDTSDFEKKDNIENLNKEGGEDENKSPL